MMTGYASIFRTPALPRSMQLLSAYLMQWPRRGNYTLSEMDIPFFLVYCVQKRLGNSLLSLRGLRSKLFKESDNRLYPAIKVRNVEFLVGRMQVVVGQPEAHHHAGDFQHVME